MSFLKNEKGSVSLIVMTIILLISVFGVTMLTLSITDYKTSHNVYWKKQSNSLTDYAIEEYQKRLSLMFESRDNYEIDANLVDEMKVEPEIIEEDKVDRNGVPILDENGVPEKVTKTKIEFHDVKLNTLTDSEYKFADDAFSSSSADGAAIYKMPPIDSEFASMNYTDIVQSGKGNVVTDGIYNPSLNTNEFFVAKTFVDNDGKLDRLEIQSYVSLTAEGYEPPLMTLEKEQIESLLPAGYNLERFTLNDELSLSTVWDENMLSPVLFIAFSVKEENKVHYFQFVPRVDTNLDYLDTIDISTEISPSSEILGTDVKATFDINMNASLFTTTIFYKKDVAGVYENGLVTYRGYYPIDDSIDLTTKINLTKTETIDDVRVFSSDLYWNEIYMVPELLLFVVTDNTSGGNVNYNGKIDVYKLAVGLDDDYSKVGTISLEDYFKEPYYPETVEPYINHLSTSVYWVEELNDGYVNMFFVAPNQEDVHGQDKLFYLETNVMNFDVNEVKEIDLPSLGIKKVGRVSNSGISSGYRELLTFINQPIVKETTIEVEPENQKNITVTTYEKDGVTIASRSVIEMKPKLEVATLEYSNVRFVKRFRMEDLEIK